MGGVCGVFMSDGSCEIQSDTVSTPSLPTNRPSDEVKINSSVGVGASNLPDDVFAIQYALNKVPLIDGGPIPQIKMDGKCDQQTIKRVLVNRRQRIDRYGMRTGDSKFVVAVVEQAAP